MKFIKRSVAVFLAILMISSSFAMIANAADALHNWSSNTVFYKMKRNADGYIIDANGNVIADEKDNLTGTGEPVWEKVENGRVAKGEKVRARVFLKTDFAMTASGFFFVYPLDFLTHDIDQYEVSGTSYTLLTNDDTSTTVGANAFGGVFNTNTEIGTSGKAYTQVRYGVMTEEDMAGLGWIYVNLNIALGTLQFDGTEWLMEFCFTVNEEATADSIGQVYLHPKCIADRSSTTQRRAATNIGAEPEGEGVTFGGSDASYLATGVAVGTFAYTPVDQDEDSTLNTTTATLTFDANGGTFADGSATKSETADIKPTTVATLPDDPKIEGGEFLGWVNADIEEPTENDILAETSIKYGYNDVAYKALYRLENSATIVINYTDAVTGEAKTVDKIVASKTDYTVKLVENLPAEGEEEENTTYVTFADLTAVEHYKFDKANASNEFSVVVNDEGTSTMNVYYVPVDYTATFNPDNGEASTSETEAYWTEITAPAAPAKDGFKFVKWVGDDGSELVPAEDGTPAKFNIAGNVTYTAQYESAETTVAVKVKYNDLANGGAEKIVDHATVNTIAGYTVALAEAAGDAEKTTYYLIGDLPEITHYEYDAANTTTTVTATADGNAELIVAYKPVQYTVTFDPANNEAATTDTKAYYTEITAPANPAKAGATFTKWVGSDGTELAAAAEGGAPAKFNLTGNVTYTAQYEDNIYNTTLSFNGEEDVDYPADAVLPTVASGNMGDEIVLTDPATVTGWNFLGWETPVGAVEQDGKYYYGTTDVTVAGNWEHIEYTVTYWLDDAKTIEYDSQTYFYGDVLTLADAPAADLMPAGKQFVEWDCDLVTMPAENIDIVAASSDIIYTVKVIVLGEEVTSFELKYGDEVTADDLAEFEEIEGYTFNFWKVANKEITLPYTVKGNISIVADTTINTWDLYFWADEADYNAFMDGDTTVIPVHHVADVEYDEDISNQTPVAPTKTGHVFRFWDMDPSTMEDNDMHFIALWKVEEYKVIWDNDGKTVEHTYEYDEVLVIPEVSKTGYEFKGWAGLAEGTTKMPDAGEDGATVTYTAVWDANSYDAVFYLDDEKTEVYATVPTDFDENIVAPADPSKDGYDFAGWTPAVGKMDDVNGKEFVATWTAKGNTPYTVSIYTMDTTGAYGAAKVLDLTAATDAPVSYAPEAKDGFTLDTANSILEGKVAADGSTNLVVKYIRNQYTFKTVVDGKETSSNTYYFEAAVAAPTTPVKIGYTFSGWDGEVPATMPAKDVTLSGTFTAAKFDLIYMVDGKQHSSEKVTFGETVTVIAPLTKDGYTFSGWDKTGTFTMPAETVTISGTFTINSYKVIYKVDGNVVHEATAEYNSKVDLYDYTPEEGYTFSGWDKEDGFTMPASEVTVNGTTSKITVTLTYKFEGDVPADYPEPAPVTATYGEDITKYDIYTGNMVTGYSSTIFEWSGVVDGEGASYVGSEDITITYMWNRIPVMITTSYTGDVPAGYESSEDWSKKYNDSFTLTTPVEEGYTFKGWTVEGAAEYDAATGTVKVGLDDITITGTWEINKHDVIYMVDGVEYDRVEDVAYGTPVTVLDDLVEAGKVFSGWDKADFTMPDEDVIINGSWTTNSYTVTYYTDKDKSAVAYTYTGAFGAEYNVPLDPEKEGHKFLGWANVADDAAAGLPEAGAITNVPLNGAEYYATWETLSYKLVYAAGTDAQFSDGTTQKTFDVAYGTAQADWDVPAEELSRPGYTFGGWDMSKAPATMGAAPVKINAIWNPVDYTVTWINGDAEVVEHYIYGEEILAPEEPVKEGWTFEGWLEADGETYFSDGDVMGVKSLVYTAQWSGNDGVEYTVSRYFENVDKTGWMDGAEAEALTGKKASEVLTGKAGTDAEVDAAAEAVNGFYIDVDGSTLSAEIEGDGSTELVIKYYRETVKVTVKDPDGITYIDDEYTYGESVELDEPEKDGFTFVEWQDGEGNKVTFPMTAPADDIVIKPIWTTNTYNITFEDDDGSIIEAAKAVEYGSTIVAPADPEKDGYNFAYWIDKDTGAVMPATMPAKDATYVAYYTAGEDTTYYIEVYTMDVNGDYTMTAQTIATGTTGDRIAVTPGELNGYTYDASLSVLNGVITADGKAALKIYYARDLYTVTFNSGDGVFADDATVVGPTNVFYGAAIPVPAEPTREGYDFAGWDAEIPAGMPADNLTFNATWTEAEYTITYIVNDKKDVKTYKFGEAVEAPADPVVAGMNFTGWDTEIPVTMPAEDLIIIAVFEISVYEVKYIADGVVFQQYAVAHGDEIPVPAEEPTKKFYKFVGWTEIPVTMPAQDIEITAIFERVPVKLIPMEGSTTVIDDETMAIYGLQRYATEEILRDSYLDVEGDGYFTVTPSKKTACGTGTVIELYDNVTGELLETYTIVIFGDLNGDSNINNSDYSIALAEVDWFTAWSDPTSGEYNVYKTMAADFDEDEMIGRNEAEGINRFVLGAVDIDQTTGKVVPVA